ncbi:hypothetical protein niasHS_002814 [Heterodera schachtii]|uniref:Uncharacterized protein n=1 Tax=Heterodera schachtii TaxID=97005 RepID=A0ABD2K2K9_HETSC
MLALSPLHQQLLPPLPLAVLLPLFLPFLPALLFPSMPRVVAQCNGGGCECCGGCGCAGCGGCGQLQSGGIDFSTAQNASSNGTQSDTQNSTNGAVKLKELVPKMVVEAKKENVTASVPTWRRRRKSTTPTDWGSEKLLTPQQLEAKFQQIRLLQQRPLAPLQPELPPIQPPDFPPLSASAGDAPSFAYANEETAGKLRPQVTSGIGQFIHVKPTVNGIGDAMGQRADAAAEFEDPTLKHPFEEPFWI